MELSDQIKNDISQNPILLYMKGTKEMPMCGFSATVVKILNNHNISRMKISMGKYLILNIKVVTEFL